MEFGETVNEIEEDGLIVTDRINVPLGSGNPRDIVKAIEFAQECTEIVVQKHGASTI